MPARVSIALLISFLACAAFFGELASKEYTKMFVSRQNLPFIHLVPTEAPPRLYMLQSLHQSVELLRATASCCELLQPFAEHSIERLMLRFGQQARLLNQLLICTEGNVFHTKTVYTSFVYLASLLAKLKTVRGSRKYNNALSERRAALIRDYLVSKGIPADEIKIRAEGKDKQIDQKMAESLLAKGDPK